MKIKQKKIKLSMDKEIVHFFYMIPILLIISSPKFRERE